MDRVKGKVDDINVKANEIKEHMEKNS